MRLNIKNKITKAFDIEARESTAVFLLLCQSVFLGVFFGAFDISSSSLFLQAFGADMLAHAFTISGVAGIAMTSLYSYYQTKINFRSLSLINLLVIAVLAILMWLGFVLTHSKWHIFIVLVMMGPMNIVALIGFGGTAGRIFSLRQGKRLFGLIDSGQIVGVIVTGFTIPVLLSFGFKTYNLLLVSAVSVVLALLFQTIIVLKNILPKTEPTTKIEPKPGENEKSSDGLLSILKNKYILLMSVFVALSMITAFFIVNSFLSFAKLKYPEDADFTKFLGVFTATMMIFTLLFKTMVYGKFMKTYGLQVALIISPILLGVLTAIAIPLGIFGGYIPTASGFIFFFLVIALSRLFSVALKSSIEAPSFKLLYQTLNINIRHNVQAQVDGTVNELSALFSGILLTVMGALSFIKLVDFTYVLMLILIGWAFVAWYLYKGYRKNLNLSLTNIKHTNLQLNKGEQRVSRVKLLLAQDNPGKVVYGMNIQEKLHPIKFEQQLSDMLLHPEAIVHAYTLNKIEELRAIDALEKVRPFTKQVKGIEEVSGKLLHDLQQGQKFEQVQQLMRSREATDREKAAWIIGQTANANQIQMLKILLRDTRPSVRIVAIRAAARVKTTELCPVLVEYLMTETYYNYAFEAIVLNGNKALDALEQGFNKTGTDTPAKLRIVRAMGAIGTNNVINYLLQKINYHNREIAEQATLQLYNLNYTITESEYVIIHQAINHIVSIIAWNITAQVSLKDESADPLIQRAFAEEIKLNYNHLYILLSLAYNKQTISHIRQTLEAEGDESSGYALELLELLIAEELKPIVFPVLDDSPANEKIKELQEHFAIEKKPLHQLLISVINRDYNKISVWVKACALNSLNFLETIQVTNNLTAQLFNPNAILRETAAFLIYKTEPNVYENCLLRLKEKNRLQLNQSIEYFQNHQWKLLTNKVLFLKKIKQFENIPGNILCSIAGCLGVQVCGKNQELNMYDKNGFSLNYIVVSGSINQYNNNILHTSYNTYSFVGLLFSSINKNNKVTYLAAENAHLYVLNMADFERIMFDNPDMAELMLDVRVD